MANGYKVKGGGVFVINRPGWRSVAVDQGALGECVKKASAVASQASSIANETYEVSLMKGKLRGYARATGEEPPSGGYWRGKMNQALWTSTRGWKRAKHKGV